MPRFATIRTVIAAGTVATLGAGVALAHHGWSWADGELTSLSGTITRIVIAPPHPTLTVEDADGTVWTVELGNPGRTQRAGFVEGTAAAGDLVEILGNRAQDKAEARIKAVRITIDGQAYDMYPERIPAES